ncbi:hypothetical protein SAMN05216480_101319 [Pustulibacterium marinum]|uniref:Uncharacterized protein n=2 Tax=Pustulibacterium marinum TaxID=1224947 RepID=A0A1I7EVV3_9FLAO|nr:hypothetical protein SAMN05216480_101319 [Pustulibacterium marinum]
MWQDDINITSTGSVGINNTAPSPSASLDLGATNRGILVNRVALTGTTDTSTISSPATGLLVYNTATTSDVTPGFYYYNGSIWVGLGAVKKYTAEYNQNNQVTASSNNETYVDLPGLSQTFTAPYTGTYQIIVNGYYANAAPTVTTITKDTSNPTNGTTHTHTVTEHQDAVGQGSIRLTVNGTAVKEKYMTATSKSFSGQTYFGLVQNATIIVNQLLTAGQSYTLKVQGREWFQYNCGVGNFGATTTNYVGSAGVSTAQYGTMTVTFVSE